MKGNSNRKRKKRRKNLKDYTEGKNIARKKRENKFHIRVLNYSFVFPIGSKNQIDHFNSNSIIKLLQILKNQYYLYNEYIKQSNSFNKPDSLFGTTCKYGVEYNRLIKSIKILPNNMSSYEFFKNIEDKLQLIEIMEINDNWDVFIKITNKGLNYFESLKDFSNDLHKLKEKIESF